MSSPVACPECKASLRLSTTSVPGKLVKCPKCGSVFRPVPARAAAAALPPKARRAPASQREEEEPEVPRARRAPAPRAQDDDELPPRRSRRDHDDRPTRKRRQSGISPLALVLASAAVLLVLIGGGVAAVLLLNRTPDSTPSTQVAGGGNTALRPPDRPGGNLPPKHDPDLDEQDPPAVETKDSFDQIIADENPGADIPPLPPVEARPHLVLDARGHASLVFATLFTPDNRNLITVSADKTVRIWDLESGETVRIIHLPVGPGDEGSLYAGALSPDGHTLAIGGWPLGNGVTGLPIYLIALESGRLEKVLKGHSGTIVSLDFSPNGKQLVSGSADRTARVYDVASGKSVELRGHTERVKQVAFSPDGTRLATGSSDKTIRIWQTDNLAAPPRVLTGTAEAVMCIAWSPDSKQLASGSTDGTVHLWGRDGTLVKTIPGAQDDGLVQIFTLRYTHDGKGLIYGGIARTGKAGIIDVASGQRGLAFKEHTNTVGCCSVSADGTLAVTCGGNDNETFVWHPTDGKVVHKLQTSGRSVWGVGWSMDGRSLCWGNTNRGDTQKGLTPLERAFRLDDFDLSADAPGKCMRSVLNFNGWSIEPVDFFNISVKHNGKQHAVFPTPVKDDRIYSVSLVPGNRMIVGTGFGGLYLVDLATNKVVRTFTRHNGIVLGITTSPSGRYFVSGSNDQVISIWQQDREDPVLSLFVAGQDWIAWTPEGYYSASACGERLMGWLVNNGPDALATYYAASQFHASLYQPDVIRFLIPTGSLSKAVARARKERKRPVQTVQLGQVLPPTVEITAPAAALEAKDGKVEIKAKARSTGEYPVVAMRLLLDGRPYLGSRGIRKIDAPKLGEAEAAWSVLLPPGKHTLAVQVASTVSKGLSSPLEASRPVGDNPELPNLYVLAIGVSEYPGKMKLHFAASDAQLIAQTFQARSKGVFGKVEVKVITDAQATRSGILQGLKWLEGAMTPTDVGIFSFSGHGTRDEDDGTFYLVPVDASVQDIAGSCVPGDTVKQSLADMPGKLVALLDCCHSGAVADNLRVARVDNLARDLVSEDYGVVVMCSSMGNEYSMESPATKAGFFTLSITEGLNGQADFNHDSVVYVHELDLYAALRVRQLSRGAQNPVTGRPPNIRSFALGKP